MNKINIQRQCHALQVSIGAMLCLLFCVPTVFASSVPNNPLRENKGEPLAPSKPSAFAVASAHPYATQAGIDVLAKGGNAFDAAISVAAVLAVVEPYSSGFGGGGFWLLKIANHVQPVNGQSVGGQSINGEPAKSRFVMIDGREMAPASAQQELYIRDGKVDRDLATNTALAAGIPGQVAALVHLEKAYGTLPLAELLKPAIHYAEKGFPVDKKYQKLAGYRVEILKRYPESSKIFLQNNKIPKLNHMVVQTDLAHTLKRVAEKGFDGFYKGIVAQKLVQGVKQAQGIWTLKDLAAYQVIERDPIRVNYFQHEIISAAPPSSGGIALAQILGQLNRFSDFSNRSELDRIHLTVESMRRAYYDRVLHLGDPDFVEIPISKLTANAYIENQADSISMGHASPSTSFSKIQLPKQKGMHTTHYSILDKSGNAVSATLSINLPFGSAYTVPETGILLNNEMDDFDAAPYTPNSYGLVGGLANAIEGKKRPLSSMTPTFIQSNKAFAILGTPGGSRIITMVALSAMSMLHQQPVEAWVSLPRYHHQFFPDSIQHEPNTFSDEIKAALKKRGHQLKPVGRQYGNMQAIHWDKVNGRVTAASDPRGIGQAAVKSN